MSGGITMSTDDVSPLEPTEIGLLARQLSMEVALDRIDYVEKLRQAYECFERSDERCQCGRVFDHEKPCGCWCHEHPQGYDAAADEIERLQQQIHDDLESNNEDFKALIAEIENLKTLLDVERYVTDSLAGALSGFDGGTNSSAYIFWERVRRDA
jgi:hypothetical protein